MVSIASNKNIKGITVEIGGDPTGLDKALKSVDDKAKDLSTELKQVNKLLKLDPNNVVLLAQKQKILAEQVENSKEKLQKLHDVQEQIERQYAAGEIDNGAYRAFNREIEDTALALKMAECQFEAAQKESKELGKSVENAGEKTEKSKKQVSDFGQTLKQAFTVGAVVSTIQGLVSSLNSLIDSSMELSGDLSRFEQNVKSSGNSLGVMQKQLTGLVALTDETDSSIEALSNLMAIGFDDAQVTQALNALSGAVIKFPDTLKIESLSDSLQETIATGKGVGQFSELIERSGYNLDEFNKKLAKGKTETDRQRIALEWLSESGLATVSEEYKEANKDLLAYKEAAHESALASAEMAEGLTPLATLTEQLKAKFFKSMASELTKLMPKIQSFVSKTNKFIGGFEDDFESISDSVEETLETVGEIGGDLLEDAKPAIKNIVKTVKSSLSVLPSALKLIYKLLKPVLDITIKTTEFASLISVEVAEWVESISGVNGATAQATERIEELHDEVSATKEEWEDLNEAAGKSIIEADADTAKITYLRDELSKLVDENGRLVGSEESLNSILKQLSDEGFTVSYNSSKKEIENYQKLKKEIQSTIQLKAYESRIGAMGEVYDEAWKKQLESEQQYKAAIRERTEAEQALADAGARWNSSINEWLLPTGIDTNIVENYRKAQKAAIDAEKTFAAATTSIDAYNAALSAGASGDYQTGIDVVNEYFSTAVYGLEEGKTAVEKTIEELEAEVSSGIKAVQEAAANGNQELATRLRNSLQESINEMAKEGMDFSKFEDYFEILGIKIPESLANGINENSAKTKNATQTAVNNAADVDTSSFNTLGQNMGEGLANGIVKKIPAVRRAAAKLSSAATVTIKKNSEINSPSKLTRRYGQYMTEGYALGMADKIRDVQAVSARVVAAVSAPAAASNNSSFNIYNTNNFNTTAARDGAELVRQINRELGSIYSKR